MKHLTLVMPYYRNPTMLEFQYSTWASYSDAIKSCFDVVIVDDGSPVERAIDVIRPAGLPAVSIYRVKEDRPWHQHGARNLGAYVAEGPWLLLTDMDHVVPQTTLERLIGLKDQRAYMLARLDAPDLTPTLDRHGNRKPHPNTFVMRKSTFWRVGGYDEDYCGVYGTDGLFRSRLFSAVQVFLLDDAPIWRYSRDVISDASTRDVSRKDGRERGAKQKIREMKAAAGRADKVVTLNFEWERQL